MQDLMKMEGVNSIENAVATKAKSGSGDAFVEYAMDIKFEVDKATHAIKFTAYATTCKLMIQPIGEKPKNLESLGNKTVARYFVDNFLLPWCEEAFANRKYDEKELLDALRNEIVRLDLLKVDTRKGNLGRGRMSSVPPDVKCVAKTCKYTGLNSNNKLAVGVCCRCGYYEHFECSKTKHDDRILILKGEQKYFCSICFSKNPTSVAFEGNNLATSAKPIKLTSTTTATPLVVEALVLFKCEVCKFETKDQDSYDRHTKEVHTFACETCSETLASSADLEKHIKNRHTRPCITCDLEFKTISELKAHMKTSHGPECTICTKSFDTKEDLEKHINENHGNKAPTRHNCTSCKESFETTEDLTTHTLEQHTHFCKTCEVTFASTGEMEAHSKTEHGISCPFCTFNCTDNKTFSTHLKENHALAHACSICERDFESKAELADHMDKEHSSDCSICGKQFKTSTDLKSHLQDCKILTCGDCDDIYYEQAQLCEHVLKKHKNLCTVCQEIFSTESKLLEHSQDAHKFRCNECDSVDETKEKLEKHV